MEIEMETEIEIETPEVNEDEQFDFYLKFAKPLVLSLPETNDRIKAAAWIRKLKNETSNPLLRTDYLKLLLYVLQRRKLIGPFASIPDETIPLQPFPEDINLQDVAKNFVEIDKKILQETLKRGGYGEWPPYNVAFSSDLKEYASSQEIPHFGTQVYFAISSDPIQAWDHVERAIFPSGEKVDLAKKDFVIAANVSPNISSFVSPEQTSNAAGSQSPPKDKRQQKDDQPPAESDPFDVATGFSPTWGSNLVKVKEASVTPKSMEGEDSSDMETSERDMLDFIDDESDLGLLEEYSDFEDSDPAMYLQGDALQSPPCSCASPTFSTPRVYERQFPSPAPSLPYRTPRIPGPQLPSPAPSLPYRTPPRPEACSCGATPDKDMLDYMSDSMELIENISFDDAGMYLTGDELKSPSPYRKYDPNKEEKYIKELEEQQMKKPIFSPCKPVEAFDINKELVLPEDNFFGKQQKMYTPSPQKYVSPPCSPGLVAQQQSPQPKQISPADQIRRMEQPAVDTTMDPISEDLGGSSFIAPERKDFKWLAGTRPGPGIPEDEQQNPELWESFGWWTDDPDEIFQYQPPSPRVQRSPDPYAQERERWADVPETPPIFSRDPRIQEGPGAQRIYAPEEFGMESFEEPVWTSAEQYMKHLADTEPFRDPREQNRRSIDLSQYPRSPEFDRHITDIEVRPEEACFFEREELPQDNLEVSFHEADVQPMTRSQAILEAYKHGPQTIGLKVPTPPKPPPFPEDLMKKDAIHADLGFLDKTPPKFMFEPKFTSTPPKYEPNPEIKADNLNESISKYIQEEMKLLKADLPVTTPTKSPSPQRQKQFLGNETLPNLAEVDISMNETCGPCSPELRSPEKHVIPSQQVINWDTNIGEVRTFSPLKRGYVSLPDEVRAANIAKQKQKISSLYKEKMASPPAPKSPVRQPHIFDAPVPDNLRKPVSPIKLPPPSWSWQTPPQNIRPKWEPKIISTPTGLSPCLGTTRDDIVYLESPPREFHSPPPSPSAAVRRLQYTPPADFEKPPSPVRSPSGRPIVTDIHSAPIHDDIDLEAYFPTEFDDINTEDIPQFYTSPPRPPTPEHIRRLNKEIAEKTQHLTPQAAKKYFDSEIDALEAELFDGPSAQSQGICDPCSDPRSPQSPATPEHERTIWKQTLKLHEPVEYSKKQWNVRPQPGKTKTIRRYTPGTELATIYNEDEPSPKKAKKRPASRLVPPKPVSRTKLQSSKSKEKLSSPPCPAAVSQRAASPPCPAAVSPRAATSPCPAAISPRAATSPCPAAISPRAATPSCPAARLDIPGVLYSDKKFQKDDYEKLCQEMEDIKSACKKREEELQKYEKLEREVLEDVKQFPKLKEDSPPREYVLYRDPQVNTDTVKLMDEQEKEFAAKVKSKKLKDEIIQRIREKFKSPPKSPYAGPSVQPFDEPVSDQLPPSSWIWKTPPQYQKDFTPRDIRSPTELSPEKAMPLDVTMYYESPPQEFHSPTSPTSPAQISSTSPHVCAAQRSAAAASSAFKYSPPAPCSSARQDAQIQHFEDEIDMDQMFPIEFESIDNEVLPELYDSPSRMTSPKHDKNTLGVSRRPEYEGTRFGATSTPLPSIRLPMTPSTTVRRPQSPVTPEQDKREWKESLIEHEPETYWKTKWNVRPSPGKTKTIKRTTVKPKLETIYNDDELQSPVQAVLRPRAARQQVQSPQNAPREFVPRILFQDSIDPRTLDNEWADIMKKIEEKERKEKTFERVQQEVAADVSQFPQIPEQQPPKEYLLYYDPNTDVQRLKQIVQQEKQLSDKLRRDELNRTIGQKIKEQFKSPPRTSPRAPSPGPHVHPFDEPIPEDLPPSLLPPSWWTWKTPPKFKKGFEPAVIRSPTDVSPLKPFSKDVSMFYESPPQGLLSPTSPTTSRSPLTISPTASALYRSPPSDLDYSAICSCSTKKVKPIRTIEPQPEPDYNLEQIEAGDYVSIDQEYSPELYVSPTKSPVRSRPKTPEQLPVDIDTEIANLENEVFTKQQTPIRKQAKTPPMHTCPASPVTPEFERAILKQKLQLHDPLKYGKGEWRIRPTPGSQTKLRRYAPGPELKTIYNDEETSPSTTPKSQSKFKGISNKDYQNYINVQKQIMGDVLDLQGTMQFTPKKQTAPTKADAEYLKRLKLAKLNDEVATQIKQQFRTPPRAPSPEPYIHPFDEPIPDDIPLPKSLLHPSYWTWKTPPQLQQRPYEPRQISSPPIISPPREYSPESLFTESPPQEILSPDGRIVRPNDCALRKLQSSKSPVKSPVESPQRYSPVKSPGGRPILPEFPVIEDEIDIAEAFPSQYENILDEYPSPELYTSPPRSPQQITQSKSSPITTKHSPYKTQSSSPEPMKTYSSPITPPISDAEFQNLQQQLKEREALMLAKKRWTLKTQSGKSFTAQRSKKPELSPVQEKYLEWSPELPTSPIPTPPQTTPQGPVIPWDWKSPSPKTLKAARQKQVQAGIIPFEFEPADIYGAPEIFTESPPHIFSPTTPPCVSPAEGVCVPCSPPQTTPPFYMSPDMEFLQGSPDVSPYISRSPPPSPSRSRSPSPSRSRSPSPSPRDHLDITDWSHVIDDDINLEEILPENYQFVGDEMPPEDIYISLPPTPPPLPSPPRPYHHQVRLTPRTRPKPNIEMFSPDASPHEYREYRSPSPSARTPPRRTPDFYARGRTPPSADLAYDPVYEIVRFEPKRPTPKQSPIDIYETPTRRVGRVGRRCRARRKMDKSAPRRRLTFTEDDENEPEMIQQLQQTIDAGSPGSRVRDVAAESPPREDFDVGDISMLGALQFELDEDMPMYVDPDIEEYEVRSPFQNQRFFIEDTSPIRHIQYIPEEERDFRWMGCTAACSKSAKK